MKNNFHGYSLVQEIGVGTFSRVFMAERLSDEQVVAIKIIEKDQYETDEDLRFLAREIELSKMMNHPNIIKIYDVVETESQIFIVMEYMPNGTLLDFINKRGRLGEVEAKHQFKQMISAIDYLHNELHVTHRDIKFENFMISDTFDVKLIDFGFSRKFDEKSPLMQTTCGSFCYAAPEMIKGQQYTSAVDIWSLGVILYGLIFGKLPFDGEQAQIINQILNNPVEFPSFTSEPLSDLLSQMLKKDPKLRITAADAMNHPWISPVFISRRYSANISQSMDISQYTLSAVRNVRLLSLSEKSKDLNSAVLKSRMSPIRSRFRRRRCDSMDLSTLNACDVIESSMPTLPPLMIKP